MSSVKPVDMIFIILMNNTLKSDDTDVLKFRQEGYFIFRYRNPGMSIKSHMFLMD